MPVEIKELHIRMAVSGKPPEPPKGAQQQGGPKSDEHLGAGNADELVAECVERVLQILQAKKER